jgi:hypothetical protein
LVSFFPYISNNLEIMSQDIVRKPGEGEGHRRGIEPFRRRQYDGFEGMNYEQIRKPFRERPVSKPARDESVNEGNGDERGNDMNA